MVGVQPVIVRLEPPQAIGRGTACLEMTLCAKKLLYTSCVLYEEGTSDANASKNNHKRVL